MQKRFITCQLKTSVITSKTKLISKMKDRKIGNQQVAAMFLKTRLLSMLILTAILVFNKNRKKGLVLKILIIEDFSRYKMKRITNMSLFHNSKRIR